MTPREWIDALHPGVPTNEAYDTVARVARAHLLANPTVSEGVQTYELVEALFPMAYAKQSGSGMGARKRIAKALTKRALGSYALADCMSEGPEQWIPWLGIRGRPTLWHAPKVHIRCAACGQEVHP